MNRNHNRTTGPRSRVGQRTHRVLVALLALLLGAAFLPQGALAKGLRGHRHHRPTICKNTTALLYKACRAEVDDDSHAGQARCLNQTDFDARFDCYSDLGRERRSALNDCRAVADARDDVCRKLGGGAYDPTLDPQDFVSGIDNPLAPFRPGAWWEYEAQTDEGFERIRVEVLDETREIQGLEATIVRDRVWIDGVLKEDTLDWLAQDRAGNVWYLGEAVQNFEDGILRDVDGSFETGRNGAKAGIWVLAHPKKGDFYRQEWDVTNAEDVVEVLSTDSDRADVPFRNEGNGDGVVQTRDTTPLDPDAIEFKFYVPGIGFVLEVKPDTGERLELVDFSL